jgi:hypothetical protein
MEQKYVAGKANPVPLAYTSEFVVVKRTEKNSSILAQCQGSIQCFHCKTLRNRGLNDKLVAVFSTSLTLAQRIAY